MQRAVPAGHLGCPFRTGDSFDYVASLERDRGELRLTGVVQADVAECIEKGYRLFDKGPRNVQIPGIHSDRPSRQEGYRQLLRAAALTQD